MSRRRPVLRTSALVAGVLLVLVAPAAANAQQPSPSPIEASSPALDDEGEVVTNDTIEQLRDDWDDATAELATIARGESRPSAAPPGPATSWTRLTGR